jgi:hypothetical protein
VRGSGWGGRCKGEASRDDWKEGSGWTDRKASWEIYPWNNNEANKSIALILQSSSYLLETTIRVNMQPSIPLPEP